MEQILKEEQFEVGDRVCGNKTRRLVPMVDRLVVYRRLRTDEQMANTTCKNSLITYDDPGCLVS